VFVEPGLDDFFELFGLRHEEHIPEVSTWHRDSQKCHKNTRSVGRQGEQKVNEYIHKRFLGAQHDGALSLRKYRNHKKERSGRFKFPKASNNKSNDNKKNKSTSRSTNERTTTARGGLTGRIE
jgi:hypothetical protein